jgi:hypothetical protein
MSAGMGGGGGARWQSKGKDRNRAVAAWETIDSGNEFYLMM